MVNSASNTTTATLQYSLPPAKGERARYEITTSPDPVTGEYHKKNYGLLERTVIIEDLRGKEDSVSLDTTGFQYFKHASKLTAASFDDEAIIKTEYYLESVEIIKKLTGASRVEIFDHSKCQRHLPSHHKVSQYDFVQPSAAAGQATRKT